jgi:hypothetical protein
MVRSLTSFIIPDEASRLLAAGAVSATTAAAFGVFCWLEVTVFDFALFFIFLRFVSHITFLLVVCCLCRVSGANRELMRTSDGLFWNQVIGESIYLLCA